MPYPVWQSNSIAPYGCGNARIANDIYYNHQYCVYACNQQHSHRQPANEQQLKYIYGLNKNLFKIENTELCCRSCNQHFHRELTLTKHFNSRKHAMRIKSLHRGKKPFNERTKDANAVIFNQIFSDIMSKETLDGLYMDLQECFNQKNELFNDIELSNLPDLIEVRRN